MNLAQRMQDLLDNLSAKGALRKLREQGRLSDFCSNDYLGLSRSPELRQMVDAAYSVIRNSGSTGSRLLSGQHPEMAALEAQLCQFHQANAALLFNSGYDANLSLFSCLTRRGDIVLYDSLVHASIHDGMRMGKAENIMFPHNDLAALRQLLLLHSGGDTACFVAVESVYSMDGDLAPLAEIQALCEEFEAYLIVDEAHATGVLGPAGAGLVQAYGLQARVFARIHTFGKAIGGHGAVLLGSDTLRNYLINFARPFIFSTAMPLHSVVQVQEAYRLLFQFGEEWRMALQRKVDYFGNLMRDLAPKLTITASSTPIQGVLIPSNEAVTAFAEKLQAAGFDVRPIRYPTVPRGAERLRICIHLFNTDTEIYELVNQLQRIYLAEQ